MPDKTSPVAAGKSGRPQKTVPSLGQTLDIRRFFMPNVDKLLKNFMHEVNDSKSVVREGMAAALKNQATMIKQNECIIQLLTDINTTLCFQRDQSAPAERTVEPLE